MKRLALLLLISIAALAADYPTPAENDYVVRGFRFQTGEQLDVRLHYTTLGQAQRDASGRVTNAVLVLHGTGGSGRGFLNATFAGVLFGAGQLLDATKYFIILPDNVGHGRSSKPSDGRRMKFPRYDYADMVALQHALLTDALQVSHLRLVMGTSMGCMHAWVWAETYPDFMDAAMPLACLPVEIAGRNRMWRKMLMDAIRQDPAWNHGDYTEEPKQGLRAALAIESFATGAPLVLQRLAPTRDAADQLVEQRLSTQVARAEANDMLYQFDASRNYNPQPKLDSIKTQVMAVNSADDFVNPPELGILEREIKRVPRGSAVVLPITEQTRGHGTHSLPAIWQGYLQQLLERSAPGAAAANPERMLTVVPNTVGVAPGGQVPPGAIGDPALGPVYRVGNGVMPPRQLYAPDPQYTEAAREAKIAGTVLLFVVIGADGLVHDVKVQRSLEPSLDQKAVDAVRTWRFEPATRDGRPVPVQVTIEVNFRLY